MKKQFFALAMMLALVAVTGNLFGQDKLTPYEDQTYEYTVGGLDAGDTYLFGVNTTVNVYTDLADGTYSIIGSNTGTVGAGGTATINIRWTGAANTVDYYYIWIQVTDSEGCFIYRALRVNPQDPEVVDENYAVNYGVVALITGDDQTNPNDIISETGSTSATDCPAFVGESWVLTSLGSTGSDGSSYLYFRVSRTSASAGTPNWEIVPTLSGAAYTDLEYAMDPNGAFTDFTSGNAITSISTADVYIRALVANGTAQSAVSVTISAGDDLGTTFDATKTYNQNAATLTVTPVPSVGSFN